MSYAYFVKFIPNCRDLRGICLWVWVLRALEALPERKLAYLGRDDIISLAYISDDSSSYLISDFEGVKMAQDIKSLKTEIVSAIEALSPENLKLLAEFVQFLRFKGNAVLQDTNVDTSSSPTADGAWTLLESLTGTIQAPPDWSSEHDYYLYGTPKRQADRG